MEASPPNETDQATVQRPLRIAIIGSGLAGAAAAGCLSRLPNASVRVYERSPEVREEGAQIAVMVSGVKSLSRLLRPETFEKLQGILYRGDGVEGVNNRHWRTGELLTTQPSPHTPRRLQEGRTGRVALHKLLMEDVPDGVVQYGRQVAFVKKLRPAVADQGAVRVHFVDGHAEDADLVVAADGTYSTLRKQYLPSSATFYRGQVAYRCNFPAARVRHIARIWADTSAWRRDGEFVILSQLEPGVHSFLAFLNEDEGYAAANPWARALGKAGVERLRGRLADWDPVIDEVLQTLPDIKAYPRHAASWMKHLVRDDAVAFIGDAAHPAAGAYGMGSSLAFGDVRALQLSLQRSYTPTTHTHTHTTIPTPPPPPPYDVAYALQLYDETRRHLLQRIEKQMGLDRRDLEYIAGAGKDEREWVRRYRERYTVNWWMLEHDVDARWQEVEAEGRHGWGRAKI